MATYYKNPTLKYYLKSLPPKALLDESVVMFVGSRSIFYNKIQSKTAKYAFKKLTDTIGYWKGVEIIG